MEEATIEDFIDDLITEKTIDGRAILADKAKELLAELRGKRDFDSMIIDNLHREKDEIKSDNKKLINIAEAVSKKI